jgi:hypothetical protein
VFENCDCVKCFPVREFFYPASSTLQRIPAEKPVDEEAKKESMRRQQLNWKSVLFFVFVISAWHYSWGVLHT